MRRVERLYSSPNTLPTDPLGARIVGDCEGVGPPHSEPLAKYEKALTVPKPLVEPLTASPNDMQLVTRVGLFWQNSSGRLTPILTVVPAAANCTRPPLSVPSGPGEKPEGSATASTRHGEPARL